MNNLEENKKVYNAIDYGLNTKNKDNSEEIQKKVQHYFVIIVNFQMKYYILQMLKILQLICLKLL